MIPTEPGYYWRHGPNHDDEIVDQIVKVDTWVSTAPSELFYWVHGDMGAIYVKEEPDVHWFGPLPSMHDQIRIHQEILDITVALNSANVPHQDTLAAGVHILTRKHA